MKTFTDLPEEKKRRILNAGLKVFGLYNYEKASIATIAQEARISKSMIFHYFGTKKDLYFYLMDYAIELFTTTYSNLHTTDISDYFERLQVMSQAELDLLSHHPHLFKFIMQFYYEKNLEVIDGIRAILKESDTLSNTMTLEGIDREKFKKDVDFHQLTQMLRWMAEGLSNRLVNYDDAELKQLESEMQKAMTLMKTCLYKEEYL